MTIDQIIISVSVCSGLALLIWAVFTLVSVRKQYYEEFVNDRTREILIQNSIKIENQSKLHKDKVVKTEYENLLKLIQNELNRIEKNASKR